MTATLWSVRRSTLRRALYQVFGICAVGGAAAAVWMLPSATAAPDPCAASEIARTIGKVAANTGDYLDSHPETNAALSMAAKQEPQQAVASLKSYFDAHPQAGKEMTALQQPLQSLGSQCKLPISAPQALQLFQGMQGAQLPGGLTVPGGGTSPLGASSANTAIGSAATTAAPAGTGPLPGPATTATR